MIERQRHDRAALGAICILAAGIAAEGARLILQRPWPGYAPWLAFGVSGVLVVLWGASLVAVLLRRRYPLAGLVAWTATFAGPLSMVAHGAVTRVGGSRWGLLYLAAGILLAILLKRCFDRGELQRLPRRSRDERVQGPPLSELRP